MNPARCFGTFVGSRFPAWHWYHWYVVSLELPVAMSDRWPALIHAETGWPTYVHAFCTESYITSYLQDMRMYEFYARRNECFLKV